MEDIVCRGETVLTPESALSARVTAAWGGVGDSVLTEDVDDVDLELEFAVEGRQQLPLSRRRFGASLIFGWL